DTVVQRRRGGAQGSLRRLPVRREPIELRPLLRRCHIHHRRRIVRTDRPLLDPAVALMTETSARIDISRWESNGVVGRMIGAAPSTSRARVPVDRVLFGSHAPYFPLETAILKLIESPLDLTQLHAIIHRNARALLAPG